MPAFAFLLGTSAAARIASLNLCTDEYLLLLARPQEIVSVSYLVQDPAESPLWQSARRYRGNRGSIEDVLTLRPSHLLTMGGGGRATALLAGRLNIRSIDLPYASSLGGVARNLRTIATALGDPHRADRWINRIAQLRRNEPARQRDAIWISSRGDSFAPDSLGAAWLRFAGFRQRALPGGRATLETLLTNPPKVLIESDYRSRQTSTGTRWLNHPIVRGSRAMHIVTDGRPWTCLGPLMIREIERLQRIAR